MQPIWIIRILFVLTMTLCGYWVGVGNKTGGGGAGFSFIALLLALFIVALEYATRILSAKKIVLGTMGAFAGLAFSRLFRDTFPESMVGGQDALRAVSNLFFMYFGVVMALRNADRISMSRLRFFITSPKEDSVLLDTSVIIDGRVKELYEMGFVSKNAIVPTFVLNELQALADSKDAAKRHNGRKGLENLDAFKDIIQFQLFEKDYPDVQGVDHKLILLAKELGASILTNDYNLGKVASLHQVRALNVNTLSASLRPNISVGDQLTIAITKEGKDQHQGVGYLEDGTMVVVDNARTMIGQSVPISILSMMQTNAGRLAFGRLLEESSDTANINILKAPAKKAAEAR
ncbi:PIN domain nuclease [soil metagenome]